MNKQKNIQSKNDKGQLHGYNEMYSNTRLWRRGVFKNNESIGYTEHHAYEGTHFTIR